MCKVRISGPGEDIWVAVLGQEVRISGPGGYLGGSFRVGRGGNWLRISGLGVFFGWQF